MNKPTLDVRVFLSDMVEGMSAQELAQISEETGFNQSLVATTIRDIVNKENGGIN